MNTRDLFVFVITWVVWLCSPLLVPATAQQGLPRVPVHRPVRLVEFPDAAGVEFQRRLIVKFSDEGLVRAGPDGDVASRSGTDLSGLHAVAARYGLRFAPLITLPSAKLDGLERRAATRSGRAQPDLAGLHAVELDGDAPLAATAADLLVVGRALQALDVVEFAHIQTLGTPPPGDIAPPTPDLTAEQTYFEPDPGMDVDFAASLGLTGAGLRLSDCEYAWREAHEDLVDRDLHFEPGQTVLSSWTNYEHGTGAVGITSAVINAYGMSGTAANADVYTYPELTEEEGSRRVAAITNAIADSDAGDVVMLEMQTVGAGFNYCPPDYDPAVWMVIRAGTDAGVVVVEAAGNGNQDLDHWLYADYMAMGDSGALVAGAGSSNIQHDKLSYSTFGARVDLQGWGDSVATLGLGNFVTYGGDLNQYYGWFSGTSSATTFVATAALLVQERWIEVYGESLDAVSLRELLVATGIPQGAGDPIGPFLDLRAALEAVPWTDLGQGLAGSAGVPRLTGRGALAAGTNVEVALTGGAASAPAYLVVGFADINVPFLGGVLVPDLAAPGFLALLGTDGLGRVLIQDSWPSGVPLGLTLYLQFWLPDAGGPFGYSASNALAGQAP
jgi:hypothetical protein